MVVSESCVASFEKLFFRGLRQVFLNLSQPRINEKTIRFAIRSETVILAFRLGEMTDELCRDSRSVQQGAVGPSRVIIASGKENRSEERRVGKECRSRCAPCSCEKNDDETR